MEAEEAQSRQQKDKKGKEGKGGKKKKKGGSSGQGPTQGMKRKGEDDEEKEEGNVGKRDSGHQVLQGTEGSTKKEEQTHSRGLGQQEKQKDDDATMADITAATDNMTLAEGKGDEAGELKQSVTSSAALVLTEDDIYEAAQDEYKCPLEMYLLTEDPVVASDGFMYSKKGLERWIAHCEAKGLPLTSPKKGEVMDAGYIINKTYRTLVRDWVEGQKGLPMKKK